MNALASTVLARAGFIDGLLGGGFWIVGASVTCLAVAVLGLAWWIATVMRPSGYATVLLRAIVGAAGAGGLTLGVFLMAVGSEAALGYPLESSSGGTALIAWWLAARLGYQELTVSASALRRLAERTESSLAAVMSYGAYAGAAGTYLLSKLFALFVLMVALDVLVLR